MVIEEIDYDLMVKSEPRKGYLASKSISYIVLLVKHEEFNSDTPSYLINLMGKSMMGYVKNVCDTQPKTKEIFDGDDVVRTIKPLLGQSEWTIVLFSDTPLLTANTLTEAFKYAEERNLNVCKLSRGFIFKTDYIKRVDQIFAPETAYFDEEDFFKVCCHEDLVRATEIMRGRINKCLLEGGVQIVDPKSTYIESGVTIEKDTIVYPCVSIMGDTHIGKKCTIGTGAQIRSAIIGERCNVQGSVIVNSVVMESTLIESSTIENNSLIEKNCVVRHYSIVSSSKIGENSRVCWSKIKGVVVAPNSTVEN